MGRIILLGCLYLWLADSDMLETQLKLEHA